VTRFVIIFSLLLVTLFTVEMLTPVQEHLIVPFTALLAHLSAAIILPFDSSVVAYGKVLQFKDTGFAVSIEAGCNGVEAAIVLIPPSLPSPLAGALVSWPSAWAFSPYRR
jgi:exosortase H (IPTLxxWG-CTERM-specific)